MSSPTTLTSSNPLKRIQVKSLVKKWLSRKTPRNISPGEQNSTIDHDNDSCVVTTDYPAYQYEFDMPCYFARLPVELLCEIFAHCLPFGRHGDQYPIPRVEDAPMLLCHVCSHWRQVALSFTALWSSFSGRCSYSYRNRNPERNVRVATQALVQLWLERSHPHPISTEFDSSMLPAVRQLLFVNAYRWDSLSIMLDDEIIGELMAIPQAGAPLVENLSLIVYECEKTRLEIPSLLPRFPNLRRLYYHNSRTLNGFFLNIPWSQMTHITLCCEFPADQFLKSLGQCMAAEYIDVQWIIPSAPIQLAQVILPCLAYLRIDSCAGDITLLDAFTVPSLRTLKFNTQSGYKIQFCFSGTVSASWALMWGELGLASSAISSFPYRRSKDVLGSYLLPLVLCI